MSGEVHFRNPRWAGTRHDDWTVCGQFRGEYSHTRVRAEVTCGHCLRWLKKNAPEAVEAEGDTIQASIVDVDTDLNRQNRRRLVIEHGDTMMFFEFPLPASVVYPEGVEKVMAAMVDFVRHVA